MFRCGEADKVENSELTCNWLTRNLCIDWGKKFRQLMLLSELHRSETSVAGIDAYLPRELRRSDTLISVIDIYLPW